MERCIVCGQPVAETDGLVRTDRWVAHLLCVFRWAQRRKGAA